MPKDNNVNIIDDLRKTNQLLAAKCRRPMGTKG
jgi:hypothetical protein